MRRLLPLLALLAISLPGFLPPANAVEPLGFDEPAKQERYETLLRELRCLVCQNQSLASSDADLAGDLRREVHDMVAQGMSDAEIKQYLLDRYGDFVLYRPRVTAETYLLWFGPALLVLVGLAALIVAIRRRAAAPAPELDTAEQARLRGLLDKYRDQ